MSQELVDIDTNTTITLTNDHGKPIKILYHKDTGVNNAFIYSTDDNAREVVTPLSFGSKEQFLILRLFRYADFLQDHVWDMYTFRSAACTLLTDTTIEQQTLLLACFTYFALSQINKIVASYLAHNIIKEKNLMLVVSAFDLIKKTFCKFTYMVKDHNVTKNYLFGLFDSALCSALKEKCSSLALYAFFLERINPTIISLDYALTTALKTYFLTTRIRSDDRCLIVQAQDATITVHNIKTNKKYNFTCNDTVKSMSLTTDSKYLAVLTYKGLVYFIDTATHEYCILNYNKPGLRIVWSCDNVLLVQTTPHQAYAWSIPFLDRQIEKLSYVELVLLVKCNQLSINKVIQDPYWATIAQYLECISKTYNLA